MTIQLEDEITINEVKGVVFNSHITLPIGFTFLTEKTDGVFISSCNWKGYFAEWYISKGFLWLKNVSGKYVFTSNNPEIAVWFSGLIYVSSGVIINGDEYDPIYEGHFSIRIEKGVVIESYFKNNKTREFYLVNVSLESQEIESLVKERGIPYLLHFTNAKNVPSIVKNGILGKQRLKDIDIPFLYNDHHRLDYVYNSVCASVSFVNYKMFYQLRCNNPLEDWAVIKISPRILWEKSCVFCFDNAASSVMTGLSVVGRMQPLSFESMFYDIGVKRSDLDIPDYYTTNPQAEVMILNGVDVDYIESVNFNALEHINDIDKIIKDNNDLFSLKPYLHDESLFTYRKDYSFW